MDPNKKSSKLTFRSPPQLSPNPTPEKQVKLTRPEPESPTKSGGKAKATSLPPTSGAQKPVPETQKLGSEMQSKPTDKDQPKSTQGDSKPPSQPQGQQKKSMNVEQVPPAPKPALRLDLKSMLMGQGIPVAWGAAKADDRTFQDSITTLVVTRLAIMLLENFIADRLSESRPNTNAALDVVRREVLEGDFFDPDYCPDPGVPRRRHSHGPFTSFIILLAHLLGTLNRGEQNLDQQGLDRRKKVRDVCWNMRYFDTRVENVHDESPFAGNKGQGKQKAEDEDKTEDKEIGRSNNPFIIS